MTTTVSYTGRGSAPVVAGSLAESTAKPVVWWAAIGAFFVAVQLWTYASWILSGDAKPVMPNPADVSTLTWICARAMEATNITLIIIGLIYVTRQSRRAGQLTFDALLVIGGFSAAWLDPSLNFVRTQFFWSSAFVNVGNWSPHIPGWVSPNQHLMPEPIFVTAPFGYLQFFLWVAIVVCIIMSKLRQRYPDISPAKLFFAGWAFSALLDGSIELILQRVFLQAYPGAEHFLSVWGGKPYQWPVYEGMLWGIVWATPGVLRFYRDDRGRSAIERGVDQLSVGSGMKTAIRIFAICGFFNVLVGSFNATFVAINLMGSDNATPNGYVSHLRNDICGKGTAHACPGPDVPIPLRDSKYAVPPLPSEY